jgi:hypothetical protein
MVARRMELTLSKFLVGCHAISEAMMLWKPLAMVVMLEEVQQERQFV